MVVCEPFDVSHQIGRRPRRVTRGVCHRTASQDVLRREQAAVGRLQSTIDGAIASGFVEMSPEELLEDIKRHTRERIVEVAEEIRSESRKADDAA